MFTWVHNCPQRASSVKHTVTSVEESDISNFELWRHPPNLVGSDDIELWWEQRLLKAAEKSDFFLRLEDDVVVNKHIEHNIQSWGALAREDFGVGSLFVMEHAGFYRHDAGGHIYTKDRRELCGPGIVFRSSLVPELVDNIRKVRKDALRFSRRLLVNFDSVILQALDDMGKKVFVHDEPCLVDCREGNGESTVGHQHQDFRSKNFDIDWKRK